MSGRRWLRLVAALLSAASLFLFGFLAGHLGRSDHAEHRSSSVLDEAADRIANRASTDVSRDALVRAGIEGMLGSLRDRYAAYYQPDDYAQFQSMLDGRYGGVGLWLRRTATGEVEVASVLPESPAAAAGLQPADEVLRVGGRDVAHDELAEVVESLRGGRGTRVTIEVRRAGALHTLSLVRAEVAVSDVTVDRLSPAVARIRVAAFTRGVGRQVRQQAARLRADGVLGIVLDLRGNPGGLLAEGVEVASAFLDGGPVVSYRVRGEDRKVFDAVGHGDTTTTLGVLVDHGTASAAEVVAGALQDRRRAVVVGATTYGKGSVQEPLRLSDGSALEITVARYLTPAGRSLDGVGVTPDIEVDAALGSATALAKAVETLSGLVADLGTPRG
jgi:carboxyl-terminal processing protease